MEALRRIIERFYKDLSSWLLKWSGVVGTVAIVVGLYRMRKCGRKTRDEQRENDPSLRSDPQASSSGSGVSPFITKAEHRGSNPALNNLSRSMEASRQCIGNKVKRKLASVSRITIAGPKVILNEGADELDSSATLQRDALMVVLELCRSFDVYLIVECHSDLAEDRVKKLLTKAGMVGGSGVKAHKLLFCGTEKGRMSIVRQLESELHIDSSQETISDLVRFIPRLLYVRQDEDFPAKNAPNVVVAETLASFFMD